MISRKWTLLRRRAAPWFINILSFLILIAGAVIIFRNETDYRVQSEQQALAQAEILAAAVTAPLDFRDRAAAQDTINAFGTNRRVRTVAVYEPSGALLASYARFADDVPPRRLSNGAMARDEMLTIVLPVYQAGTRIGTISITSEQDPLVQRLGRYILLGLLVILVVIVIAVLTAARNALQRANATLRQQAEDVININRNLQQQMIEREKAEAATRDVDALFRAYFENTSEALFIVEAKPDGTFVFVDINPANTRTMHIPAEAMRGRRPAELFAPEIVAAVEENYRRCIMTGQVQSYAEVLPLPTGTIYFETVLVPIRDRNGRVSRIMGSARNVTERVRLEEALRQSQKMEAMGALTGGVAHDFNNLLTPIVAVLDMLQRKSIGGEREQKLIGAAAQSADRAKTLVQRLLAFARRQPLQASAVDLAELTRGMAELIASTTGPQIRVELQATPALPPAIVDANQLEMAILNLAVNARDAMPDGGTLRILVEEAQIADGHRSGLPSGRYLYLAVADDGEGMDAATLSKAIEPFFSTKGIGKGTGLGLSMVHGLAIQLGGTLTIESAVGQGTTVELWLPQGDGTAVTIDRNVEERPLPKAKGIVLLVDDEQLVRLSTADLLTELGYVVVEADCAEAALALLDGGLAADIVITDHLMPGISGVELAGQLQRTRPHIKTIIVSGYAEPMGLSPHLQRLTKPFRSADLAATLEALV